MKISLHLLYSQHWHGTGSWHSSFCKTRPVYPHLQSMIFQLQGRFSTWLLHHHGDVQGCHLDSLQCLCIEGCPSDNLVHLHLWKWQPFCFPGSPSLIGWAWSLHHHGDVQGWHLDSLQCLCIEGCPSDNLVHLHLWYSQSSYNLSVSLAVHPS